MNANKIMKLFGISKTTLIYYEKKGIFHVKRDQNNYRVFSILDIINLLKCKKYQEWNLTIPEAENIIKSNSLDTLIDGTDKGIERLNKELLYSQLKLQYLKNTSKELKLLKFNENCCYTEFSEKIYCTKISQQLFLDDSIDFFNESKFTNLIKYSGFIKMCYFVPPHSNLGTWYMCIDSSIADKIENYPISYDTLFDDSFFYVTYIKINKNDYTQLYKLIENFKQESMKKNIHIDINFGAICKICGTTNSDNYIKIMIPLKNEKK